jgi:hypothetical protein
VGKDSFCPNTGPINTHPRQLYKGLHRDLGELRLRKRAKSGQVLMGMVRANMDSVVLEYKTPTAPSGEAAYG